MTLFFDSSLLYMTETNPPLDISSIGRGTFSRTGDLVTHALSALRPIKRRPLDSYGSLAYTTIQESGPIETVPRGSCSRHIWK